MNPSLFVRVYDLNKIKSDSDKATGTQLLDRAVAILKHLSAHGQEGVTATKLAELLNLNASTAHRIIAGLERHGLIEKDNSTKLYRLSMAFFALGASAADGTGYRRLCRPTIMELAASTGDTVFLMARSGFNAICVDRQEGDYIIDSLTGGVGGQIPLGVGPASQSILAYLDEAEAKTIIKAKSERSKNFNRLSSKEISSKLQQIREKGYAVDHGRLVEGISAVAVPIRLEGRDAIGSIAINMTSARLKEERLSDLVKQLNNKIARIELFINPLDFPAVSRPVGRQLYA